MNLEFRQRLLATTLFVGAGMLATPAVAQETAPPPATPQQDTAADTTQPSGPVEGQPVSSTSAQGEPVQESQDIVVTGTRIPQPNLESAAPVTVVSSQDIKLQGTTRIEDLLNSLPSVGASQASGLANGATGTAEVDLRYLGSKRTLTLVNGRRLVPGDPNSTTQAADLNVIPSSIVKRVEVLTGGASSVYGADAVAGVVNFIMDTNFTGIRFDGQYSFYQHNNNDPSVSGGLNVSDINAARGFRPVKGSVADGGSFDGTVSIGVNFDDNRGHAVAYFGYRKVRPVLQGKRDFSNCTIQNTGAGIPRCGGSATANPGTAFFVPAGGNATSTFALGPGTITPGANLYNFAPLNYFQRPDERYIGGVFANYELNDAIKPYLEFMFMDDRTLAQIAPGGNFGNTLTINCDNPLLSPAQLTAICNPNNLISGFLGTFPLVTGTSGAAPINFANTAPGGAAYQRAFFQLLRRNTEGGPRISDLRHTSFRGVLGTRGDLDPVWSYDAYYQYGRTNYTQVYRNEFSAARLARALDVVIDPATNLPVCRSVLDATDPNCVPYDVFGAGGPSAEAINYLNVFGVIQGNTSEQVANINFTGLLGEYGLRTPWAEDGFGINVGFEYRKEKLELNPDQSFQSNDLTGQGGATLPVNGSFDVKEVFAEAQLPLIQRNFIEDLSLGLGYRKSWYKLSSGRTYDTDTYKVSLEFAPIRDIRFRGAYNRASRAPNIQELFAPQNVALGGTNDPCAGLTDAAGNPRPVAATDFGCIASGLPVGSSTPANPAGQYNALLGGNPDLSPEKATTKTLGVILQPRVVPRLAVTVDYFNIKVKDAIQGFGADAILQACVTQTTSTAVSPACSLVNRNPGNGSLWLTTDGFTVDLPNNEGTVETAGIDLNASYSLPVGGFGNLSASFIGTYLDKYKVSNGLTEDYDCAGLYGPICSGGTVASSAPMPRWRHKARTTLQMRNGIGISLQWRMVGKVRAETLEDNETLGGENNLDPGLRIKAQHYFDLASTVRIGDNYNFRIGVNNILDNDPPLVTSGNAGLGGSNLCPTGPCNGNTYPGTWDALGRFFYAGVTLDF